MAWLFVLLAGACEVIGVFILNKLSKKFSIMSLLLLFFTFFISFTALSKAMETISMGTAYAVWTGIGSVGATLVGMFLFGESKDMKRLMFIFLIVISVVGLKLIS